MERHMENLLAQLEKALNPDVDGGFEALILTGLLRELKPDQEPTRPQHEVFADMCRLALAGLKQNTGTLSSSEAAEPLLKFLAEALQRYLTEASSQPIEPSAADRHGILARAFGLTRTDGRRVQITEQQRITICNAYADKIYALTGGTGRQPTKREADTAQREAFKALHGKDWADAGPDAKKTIRMILRANGYRS